MSHKLWVITGLGMQTRFPLSLSCCVTITFSCFHFDNWFCVLRSYVEVHWTLTGHLLTLGHFRYLKKVVQIEKCFLVQVKVKVKRVFSTYEFANDFFSIKIIEHSISYYVQGRKSIVFCNISWYSSVDAHTLCDVTFRILVGINGLKVKINAVLL